MKLKFLFALLLSAMASIGFTKEIAEYDAVDRTVSVEHLECDDIFYAQTDEDGNTSLAGTRWENARHVELRQFTNCAFYTGLITATPYAANAGEIVLSDSSGGVREIDQPTSPSADDFFAVVDATGSASTNNITVDFTDNLHGQAIDYVLQSDNEVIGFKFVGGATGWVIVYGHGGGSGVGVTDGDKGDITISGGGTVYTVDSLPSTVDLSAWNVIRIGAYANCDGSDETSAIQSAFDLVTNYSIIKWPDGETCNIGTASGVTLQNHNHLLIDFGTARITSADISYDGFNWGNPLIKFINIDNSRIIGGFFDGSAATLGSNFSTAFILHASEETSVEDVTVFDFTRIANLGESDGDRNTWKNIYSYDTNGLGNADGIKIGDIAASQWGSGVKILDSVFENNQGAGIWYAAQSGWIQNIDIISPAEDGVFIDADFDTQIDHLDIGHVRVTSPGDWGFEFSATSGDCEGVSFHNNASEDAADGGLYWIGCSRSDVISNTMLRSNTVQMAFDGDLFNLNLDGNNLIDDTTTTVAFDANSGTCNLDDHLSWGDGGVGICINGSATPLQFKHVRGPYVSNNDTITFPGGTYTASGNQADTWVTDTALSFDADANEQMTNINIRRTFASGGTSIGFDFNVDDAASVMDGFNFEDNHLLNIQAGNCADFTGVGEMKNFYLKNNEWSESCGFTRHLSFDPTTYSNINFYVESNKGWDGDDSQISAEILINHYGLKTVKNQSASITGECNTQYLFDTSSAVGAFTMPTNPTPNCIVRLIDQEGAASTNNVNINSFTNHGSATTRSLTANKQNETWEYIDSTIGWILVD